LAIFSLAAACCATGPALSLAAGAPKPVVTNKTHFRIPFRFDAAALERMNARELRLYVSSDGGNAWELTQSIGIESGRFEFQAPGDGEYRFAVKTLDARNQLHPPGEVFETGLIVLVDATPPELKLDLRSSSPGKVELHWRAADPNLDPASLRLEYTQPGVDEWQSVSVAARSTGHTAWSAPQGGIVAVRGAISDRAGNQTRSEARARTEPANTSPRKPDPRQPIAANPESNVQNPEPDYFSPPEAVSAPASRIPMVDSGLKEHFTSIEPQQAPLTAQMQAATQPETPVVEREPILFTQPTHLVTDEPSVRPEIAQDRWESNREPGIQSQAPENHGAIDAASGAGLAMPNARGAGRIVRAAKFQIGYQIDDIGPSGVGGVELFVTQDQGRKWWRYGEDADRQSPFDVEVPGDGEYGFAIRARSGVGLAEAPPTPGEMPAIVIVVDQTPPAVELLPVRQGAGPQANKLQLRWTTAEAHPAEAAVALFYAGSPEGPWETISNWRADTGEFVWTVAPGAPTQIFFRIVVRDSAGNMTQQQTPRPVVIDLSRPTARIVDVEGVDR
jgi:hypothetical protein